MAIDGHPFFTKELDAQRSHQRAVLAGLWDRTFGGSGLSEAPRIEPEPTGMVETALRRVAQALIDQAGEVLDRPRRLVEGNALRAWSRNIDQVDWPSAALDRLAEEIPATTDEGAVMALAREHYELLSTLAAFLMWADDAAGDYTDPRVASWRDSADH